MVSIATALSTHTHFKIINSTHSTHNNSTHSINKYFLYYFFFLRGRFFYFISYYTMILQRFRIIVGDAEI